MGEFGKQLAHVDSEIKGLTNNLEKRGKELETCKKEYVELKVKNREMANNSAAMLCEKSQLLQRVDNLESIAKNKVLCDCIEENEEKMKCFKTEIEQKNKEIRIA